MAALVGLFLDSSLFIVLHRLLMCTGQAVYYARNLQYRVVVIDDGSKVHVELCPAPDAPGASDSIHNTLHIHTGWNHDRVAIYNGECRGQIDAIARFGAFGVDGVAPSEQDFGSGNDDVD